MLNVTKDQIGTTTLVKLSGVIDEEADLNKLIGNLTSEATIDCMGIERINSVGCKAWIRFFQKLQVEKKRFKFVACSVVFMEQTNMISNFACGGTIESFYAPFICVSCGAEGSQLLVSEDIGTKGYQAPLISCLKCGKPMELDADPEDYFYFLNSRP
jgi:anti-anti-sigma regulatory factor